MKVSELIELLEDQDPNAEVLIMTQENWPFENAIKGIAVRDEMLRADHDEDGDEDPEEEAHLERGTARNDVFIVEGTQLRYGSKTAWSVVTR